MVYCAWQRARSKGVAGRDGSDQRGTVVWGRGLPQVGSHLAPNLRMFQVNEATSHLCGFVLLSRRKGPRQSPGREGHSSELLKVRSCEDGGFLPSPQPKALLREGSRGRDRPHVGLKDHSPASLSHVLTHALGRHNLKGSTAAKKPGQGEEGHRESSTEQESRGIFNFP